MTSKIKSKTRNLNVMDKAIILKLEFHRPGNQRKLKADQYTVDADKDMVHATKQLLDSDELKAVAKFDSETWNYVASRALPSTIKGFWVMPVGLLEEVDGVLESRATKRGELVDVAVKAYPKLLAKAPELLRGVYDEADYPSADEFRRAFGFSWRYVSFGVPEQLEQIKADVFKREQDKAAKHWEQATEGMQALMRHDMAEMVDHMIDRLTPTEDGKVKVFRSSMIDNVHDFLTTFEARNITDDAQLQKLVAKARGLVDGVAHDTLKTDAEVRDKVRKGMSVIKTSLDKLVVIRPTRKIRFEEAEAA
jgi:hypothetical protein